MRIASVALLLVTAACHGAPPPAPVRVSAAAPPPSALGGAVVALEALARSGPPGALVQVRALECDALASTAGEAQHARPEVVRVFLHLTVYSMTPQGAHEGYELLERRLGELLAAPAPAESLTRDRVQRVLGELDWDPTGREDLYSFSDTLRLIVPPGAAPRMLAAPPAGSSASTSLASFVRARAEATGIGTLALESALPVGSCEVRCAIQNDARTGSYLRAEIGAFLAALEEASPATRVTRLALEHSQEAADLHAERSWTFHAELGVAAE